MSSNNDDTKEKLLLDGLELMQKNQMDAAIKCFEKAIHFNPKFTLACTLEMASHGLKRNPQEVASLGLWANALTELGRLDEALKIYEKITKIQPESKRVWMDLAHFYEYMIKKSSKEGFSDRAIINPMEIALELDPDDVHIMFGLAILYGENKDYAKSLSYLERIAAIKPLTRVQQRFMEETKKQIAKGLSRPFIDLIKKEALPVSGGENVCPKCGDNIPLNLKFCNNCEQKMI